MTEHFAPVHRPAPNDDAIGVDEGQDGHDGDVAHDGAGARLSVAAGCARADGSASRPGGDLAHPDPRIPLVRLGLTTAGDPGELAARLTADGHPAHLVEGGAVCSVPVIDPDGQHLEIHPGA